MTNLRPPSLSQVMAQNTAQSQAQYSASQSGGSSGGPSGGGSSGGSSAGSSAGYTAPNYGTGGPIRSQDFNAGWRHDNNGNWVNINAPSGSQYHGTQGLPDWQKNCNNTPNVIPQQQPQNDAFRQQQEMERQQREMLERQNEQNRQMQQQQMDAMRQQNDAWQKRQEEMQNNMRRMQAETPNFITDRHMFEKMTGYAGKNDQERKVVDDYWNNASIAKNKNASHYYDDIKNGVATPDYERGRPEYSQAQATYSRIAKYKQMNSGQLANLFKNGELTSGELALLSKENPSLAMDVAFTNSLNNAGKVNFEADQLAMSNDILTKWHTDLNNDERKSLLANALSEDTNISNAMNDTKNKANKLAELQKSVLEVSDSVDKELEGKNVSKAYANALKAKRSGEIHTAIASAQIDYSNAMNYQRDLIENKKYDIDYQRQLENRKFQVGQQVFFGRENQRISQENALYDTKLGLQKNQWEYEQKLRQEQEIRNNPTLATQQMIDQYRKMGVNAQRSDAEIIADVQQKVANGRSLGEVLSELNQAFQGKQEYKTIQRLHNGQVSDREKQQFSMQQAAQENAWAMQKMAVANQYEMANTLQKYNLSEKTDQRKAIQELVSTGQMSVAEAKALQRNINGNWNGASGAELLFAEDGTWIKSQLKETTNKSGGIECAEYISRMTGTRVGNTWEEKKKLNREKTGKIGSIMVWQPSQKGAFAKYGHAGIIVGEDGNNWIVKNANYKVDGKVSTIRVPKNMPGAQYRSTNLLGKIGAQTQQTSPAQSMLDAVNAGTLTIQEALSQYGTSKEGQAMKTELMNLYSQQGGHQFNSNNGEYQQMAQQIEDLKALRNDEMMSSSVGPDGLGAFTRTSFAPWNWGKKDAYLAKANQVLNNSVLNKLIESKANGATFGALSDTELSMLQKSSNVLNALAIRDKDGNITGFKGTEENFQRAIDNMISQSELVMQRMSQKGVQGKPQNNPYGFGNFGNFMTSAGKSLASYFN